MNITDRFIGEDPTGRCLITAYNIYKVTDNYGKEVKSYKYNKCMTVDEKGIITFKNLTDVMDYKVYISVFNSYEWIELD